MQVDAGQDRGASSPGEPHHKSDWTTASTTSHPRCGRLVEPSLPERARGRGTAPRRAKHSQTAVAGRYKFRETVLYDFIDSGAEDFVTFVEDIKGE